MPVKVGLSAFVGARNRVDATGSMFGTPMWPVCIGSAERTEKLASAVVASAAVPGATPADRPFRRRGSR
ncbi:hypothetical protein HEB94_004065 [Actinopolymorpha pittospori]|uniref:Uncharacterized protein n=1 Tax=Actinopolymorpha pittospori TaxID=648752 RepID=A0A927R8X4_9ACTN|nr:hypothetical protein [Actinopolymorpha pittospori]